MFVGVSTVFKGFLAFKRGVPSCITISYSKVVQSSQLE